MAVESLFDEDHLVPIAFMDATLFAFSRLDGCLYRISSQWQLGAGTYEPVPLTGFVAPFCVPGRPSVYDLIHSSATVTVREFPLAETGLGKPFESIYPSPPSATHQLVSLIPDAEGETQRLVFESLAEAQPTLLMDIRSGHLMQAASINATPKCILSDGTLVAASESGWSMVRAGTGQRHSSGSVVATASGFVVVKRSSKSEAKYFVVRGTGESEIVAPKGWSLVSLAASDTCITAYGIHPEQGQRLLSMTPGGGSLAFMETPSGTSQVFAMGPAMDPVVRTTGLATGSCWLTPGGVIGGIAPERPDLQVSHITPAGLPCVYVDGEQSRRGELVVCLHGGPDSHELDDLRYGGTYRTVLDAGFALLIVNYPGSAGFGSDFQKRAWHNWDASVRETAGAVAEVMAARGTPEVSIFGVSFGAWLGLQLAEYVQTRRVVAMSPIINLAAHLRLHQDEPEFRTWAEARFPLTMGVPDHSESHVRNGTSHVVVIAPADDEVVMPGSTQESTTLALELGLMWSTVAVPGNHYPQTSAAAEHRWAALFAAFAHSRAAHPAA